MVETLVYPVGDGAIVKQRGEYFTDTGQHIVDAGNVEEGFLLPRKRGIGQVFRGGR